MKNECCINGECTCIIFLLSFALCMQFCVITPSRIVDLIEDGYIALWVNLGLFTATLKLTSLDGTLNGVPLLMDANPLAHKRPFLWRVASRGPPGKRQFSSFCCKSYCGYIWFKYFRYSIKHESINQAVVPVVGRFGV